MIEKPPPAKSTVHLSYVLLLAATAALGGLLFGFDIAIITGAGPFLIEHFGLSDLSLGIAFSSLLFGCVLGSAVAGRVTDRFGRRRILLWVALIFALTSIQTALASSFSMFLIARFLGGIAVGGASILSPMYVAEISPPAIRGRMGALYQFSIILGILMSYAINYLLRNAGSSNWRWMFMTGALPALLFFVLLIPAPETPRFLAIARREKEALRVLTKIGGTESAASQLAEIRASLSDRRNAWRDLFQPGIRRAVLVSFVLAILIHVSGINTVIDYAPTIFKSAGWKIDAALFSTFIVGVTNFVFTVLSFWMIDRFGRKPLYVLGSLGMAGALLALTAISWSGHFRGAIVLVLILTYLACFASAIGPVFWTLVPEIFPNHIRGTAMTIPVLTQWIANAMVVLFFPLAFNQVGKSFTFAFLAIMSLLQALFTWRFLPETKGKSLEEIEQFWLPVS
jgi:MFS transporter, SP family, arabinose:H+ symporter